VWQSENEERGKEEKRKKSSDHKRRENCQIGNR